MGELEEGTCPPRDAEEVYYLVTKPWLHTIIHEVAIAGYTNENYSQLRVLDFFSKGSFMFYLVVKTIDILGSALVVFIV